MLTPQSNATLVQIAQAIREHDTFALCGHVNPDGDCLGSELALAHALRALGKQVDCLLARDEPIPHNLAFLPGSELLTPASACASTPQVFIALDVPTSERLGDAAAVQQRAGLRITVDHHATDGCMAELNHVDPDAAAASCLVWTLVGLLDAKTEQGALCALTGVMTDTGRFSYQNTDAQAFAVASDALAHGARPDVVAREFFQSNTRASVALKQIVLERIVFECGGAFAFSYLTQEDFDRTGGTRADAESLIDELRGVQGVRVALILRDAAEGKVRGSLRAKDDTDVAAVARSYAGGGHRAAAGFTFDGSMAQALSDVPATVRALCFGTQEG